MDNTVDPTTSTVLVKAEVPNPDQTLLPGEYVKVELNIGDYAGVVVVPDRAVVEAQEGSRVLVVDAQNKVQVAIVKSLDTYQGLLVLESGLTEGQKVIVKGIQLVRPGQTVEPEEVELKADARAELMDEAPDPLTSPLVRIRGVGRRDSRTCPRLEGPGAGSGAGTVQGQASGGTRTEVRPATEVGELTTPWSTSSSAGRSSPRCSPC